MQQSFSQKTKTMQFHCPFADKNKEDSYWTGIIGNGYDKINGAYSPSNDALYFAQIIKGLYNDWYQVEPLYRSSGLPQRLIMRVHYGEKYANAFWDGKSMSFGDGDDLLYYPFVTLTITAHEISHGFTQQHADLQYFSQSGSINESFSDMASMAATSYAQLPINWRIGHDVVKPKNDRRAIRYLDQPHLDGRSFDTVTEYLEAEKNLVLENKSVNVHYGSGVFNRLFYLLATSPNWTIRKAFHVMLTANMDYWLPLSDFQDAGCGVLHATKHLGYETDAVKEALQNVGIDWNVCV